MIEWYSAAELAALALPGIPGGERGIQLRAKKENWAGRTNVAGGKLTRKREGRGGGVEYHYTLLPSATQAKIVLDHAPAKEPKEIVHDEHTASELWTHFEGLSDKRKADAKKKLHVINSVELFQRGGLTKNLAVETVAANEGVASSTVYNWLKAIAGVAKADRLPALAPRYAGRTKTVDCPDEIWESIKSDFLRAERRTFESCYRLGKQIADAQGLKLPSVKTLQRRIDREVAVPVQILARKGVDALKALYPAQERDRSVFHALEAVNADGHKFDVWVQWPDEPKPIRAMLIAIQDLYSGMFVGWRIAKSENQVAVRLAIGDMVEKFGIPDHIYLDNGRSFASKWLTGGIANRFRFKIKDDEPVGILTQLGVEVHWTLPYSGQSKPIERAFRDFCNDIAKHSEFEGAWTGNNPLNKPENYGSRAVPLEDFVRVINEGIHAHNKRPDRRAKVCKGRSFYQTFKESYEKSIINRATEEQQRLWLLAAEGVQAARIDGSIKLMGNRYWADFLHAHMGQKLVIRFDPDNLHAGIHVYRLDGSYLDKANVVEAVGFSDADAARDHGRKRKQFMNNNKANLALHKTLTGQEIADQLPTPPNMPPMENTLARPVFNTDQLMKRPQPKTTPLNDAQKVVKSRVVEQIEDHRKIAETRETRFARACDLEVVLDAGDTVSDADRNWLQGYQNTAEYKTFKRMQNFGEAATSA